MAEDKLLYTTRVHNDQGIKGTAWVEGEMSCEWRLQVH